MTFIDINCGRFAIEHRPLWIYRGSQRSPEYLVNEARPESMDVTSRAEARHLRHQCVTQDVIGIQGKHPLALDLSQTEIALGRRAIKIPPNHHRLGMLTNNFERAIRAAAVDD
jgi:hypothetical protein